MSRMSHMTRTKRSSEQRLTRRASRSGTPNGAVDQQKPPSNHPSNECTTKRSALQRCSATKSYHFHERDQDRNMPCIGQGRQGNDVELSSCRNPSMRLNQVPTSIHARRMMIRAWLASPLKRASKRKSTPSARWACCATCSSCATA